MQPLVLDPCKKLFEASTLGSFPLLLIFSFAYFLKVSSQGSALTIFYKTFVVTRRKKKEILFFGIKTKLAIKQIFLLYHAKTNTIVRSCQEKDV